MVGKSATPLGVRRIPTACTSWKVKTLRRIRTDGADQRHGIVKNSQFGLPNLWQRSRNIRLGVTTPSRDHLFSVTEPEYGSYFFGGFTIRGTEIGPQKVECHRRLRHPNS
jgi:hypothetical protein